MQYVGAADTSVIYMTILLVPQIIFIINFWHYFQNSVQLTMGSLIYLSWLVAGWLPHFELKIMRL